MFCGACGTKSADGNQFCENCGRPFGGAPAQTGQQNHGGAIPTQTKQASANTQPPIWDPAKPAWYNMVVIGGGLLFACFVVWAGVHFFHIIIM